MGPKAPNKPPKNERGYGGVTHGKMLNFQVEIKPSPAFSGNVTDKYWVMNEANFV